MSKAKTFALEISLNERQVAAICNAVTEDIPETQKIQRVALGAMRDLGEGGAVLDGSIMRQIYAATGPIEDYQEIVQAVEAGKGRRDGSIVATWRPDPTYLPAIEQAAISNGSTVDQTLQGIMDYGMANGWYYEIRPDTVVAFFTRQDFSELCETMGKEHITGTDIADYIRQQADPPQFVEEKIA